ncbi:hypothetical protein [Rhodoferax sediminis]|uniref:HTH marR-type domain-containing protein n=1 Tax=Rhodoferax sediminis TaxID=2509614 RepID=A0A515D7P7_9BURK|nr:hypothetical protein [Rhodoferax sediminis]QDL36377.1 hypothetical protein EUB48_02965 [Rhodoferax sediminis]
MVRDAVSISYSINLARAAAAAVRLISVAAAPLGLSPAAASVLVALENGQPANYRSIEMLTGLGRTNLIGHLGHLEQNGFVSRIKRGQGQSLTSFRITESGKKLQRVLVWKIFQQEIGLRKYIPERDVRRLEVASIKFVTAAIEHIDSEATTDRIHGVPSRAGRTGARPTPRVKVGG